MNRTKAPKTSERQGASRRFLRDIPAASALPLTKRRSRQLGNLFVDDALIQRSNRRGGCVDERDWAAGGVDPIVVGVDAQMTEDRGGQIAWADAA